MVKLVDALGDDVGSNVIVTALGYHSLTELLFWKELDFKAIMSFFEVIILPC